MTFQIISERNFQLFFKGNQNIEILFYTLEFLRDYIDEARLYS